MQVTECHISFPLAFTIGCSVLQQQGQSYYAADAIAGGRSALLRHLISKSLAAIGKWKSAVDLVSPYPQG